MKIRSNIRAGTTTSTRCGGATRCSGGGSSDPGGDQPRVNLDTYYS